MSSRIYGSLQKHWEVNKFKFYKNQNKSEAGREDCEEIYLNEPISGEIKNELAKGLLELFIATVLEDEDDAALMNYLNRYPLIQYYFILVDKMKILLKEDIIAKKDFHIRGMDYATNFDNKEVIRFGLMLLRFSEQKEALETLSIYSNHNDYIFYSIEGIKEYEKCNSIIFDIAKASKGYGRVIAVTNLEPLNIEIKKWLLKDATKNEFLQQVLAAITFDELYFLEYFNTDKLTLQNYNLITRNLKVLYEMKDFFIEHISLGIILLYWRYFNNFKPNFESVYVMAALLSFFYKQSEDEGDLIGNLNLLHEEEIIIDEINKSFISGDYKELILNEIKSNRYNIKECLDLALAMDIEIEFECFKEVLNEDPVNICIYNYIIAGTNDNDKESLIEFTIENNLFENIVNGAQNINEGDIDLSFEADTSLFLIIRELGNMTKNFFKFNIQALNARYLPTRREALNNIKKNKELLNEEYISLIKNSYLNETNDKLRKSLGRFLSKVSSSNNESKIVNIGEVTVEPNSKDILLIETEIAGLKYSDISVVEDELSSGQTVYLKRDKENIYDDNAIMVLTKEGYQIGYIPRKENYILKNLMDWGKILYGTIVFVDEDYSKINIELYLSNIDIVNEVTYTFNMITQKPTGYIN